MAGKKTPNELRKQAQEMTNKAKNLEKDENAKLGAAVRAIAAEGFNIDYEELKTKVYGLVGREEKLSTNNQTANPISGNVI